MSTSDPIAESPSYSPARLLDTLSKNLRLSNDAALARALETGAPVLSKIRNRKSPVTGAMLIRMHEVCGLEIAALRELIGDRRHKFRVGTTKET